MEGFMKHKSMIIACMLIGFMAGSTALVAQDKKEANFSAKEPILLTSAGQSADSQIVKVLLERNKIGVKSIPLAGPGDLEGAKTLVIAVGGSSKGLGAAGIDADKELARVQQILAKAKQSGIPVLAMHVGGISKRGELSDRFISQVIPASAFLIAIKEGDQDGFLTRTAANSKVQILIVERISELQEPLKSIFGKK
jgi:hypothetical protein